MDHLQKLARFLDRGAFYISLVLKKYLWPGCKRVFYFSGLQFVYRKFVPAKGDDHLPSGFIWLVSIYIAAYGIASQRYNERINLIQAQLKSVTDLMLNDKTKKAGVSNIRTIQSFKCPKKPIFLEPLSTFESLFGKSKLNRASHKALQMTIETLKSDLTESNFSGTHFGSTNFIEYNLSGSNFSFAGLAGSNFHKATLVKTSFSHSNLTGCRFDRSNAEGAFFSASKLRYADFFLATASKSYFSYADLRNARLSKANLNNCFFLNANMQGADLTGASLEGAYLHKTNLMGVTGLTYSQLISAKTLYGAEIDLDLLVKVKLSHPMLFQDILGDSGQSSDSVFGISDLPPPPDLPDNSDEFDE